MSAKIYKNGQWVDLLNTKKEQVSFNTANAVPENIEITNVSLDEQPKKKPVVEKKEPEQNEQRGKNKKQWAENKMKYVLKNLYFKVGINDEARLYIAALSCLMSIEMFYGVNYGKEIFQRAVDIRNEILAGCREIENNRKKQKEEAAQEQPVQKQEQPVQEVKQEPVEITKVEIDDSDKKEMTEAEIAIIKQAEKMLENGKRQPQQDNPFRASVEEIFMKDKEEKEKAQQVQQEQSPATEVVSNSNNLQDLVAQEEDFGVSDDVEVQYEAEVSTNQDIINSINELNSVSEKAKEEVDENGNSKASNSLREQIKQRTSTTYTDPNGNRMSF